MARLLKECQEIERKLPPMAKEDEEPVAEPVDGGASAETVDEQAVRLGVLTGSGISIPDMHGLVKQQAEQEGLAQILIDAGFDWREPGCSMCVAMNGDYIQPGQRCASTSNRNFEGRQGREGRTHLASPAMVAAAAVTGRLTDVRDLEKRSIE